MKGVRTKPQISKRHPLLQQPGSKEDGLLEMVGGEKVLSKRKQVLLQLLLCQQCPHAVESLVHQGGSEAATLNQVVVCWMMLQDALMFFCEIQR